MDKKNNYVNRRDLLKNSLLATAAAAGGLASAQGMENQQPLGQCSDEKMAWDRHADVVVIGSGTGLVAALAAAKAGKRVLILEKSPAPGGNTVVSGGVFWVPNNRVMQREGLRDSRESARQYLAALAQGQATNEIIDAFLDNGPDMVDFIEANTSLTIRVSKLMGEVADYHPEWRGSNIKGRSLEPVQSTVGVAGGLLITSLLQAVIEAGGELLTACPAKRLLIKENAQGGREITGVVAEQDGKLITIAVGDGVLMASGGFERNSEMKLHFLRGPSPYTLGAETNTGDGIHMGMAAGADLRNMNEVWGITVYSGDAKANGEYRGGIGLHAQIDRRNAGCIAVNRYGERFCNEAADYDSSWRSYHSWQNWGELGYRNMPAYQIFDQAYREKYTLAGKAVNESLPDWVIKADSIEALAEKLSIDKDGLRKTVARFNQFARNGVDEDFARGKSIYDTYGAKDPKVTLAALAKPPFYGAEISPADLGTCGGLRVNGEAQVIDVFGIPIKGLYASGNCAGVGSPGALYGGGGGTIGPAMTFAYIAGKRLAAN
jgi:3-oxosteroid 1-dehydrogenase